MAVITTIGAIVGIAAKGGWFAKAEFADEILGDWDDREDDTGGLVLALEDQTGQIYPRLREMREEAIQKFYKFRNALPWNKGSTASTYEKKVQDLAHAIEAEARAHQETGVFGGLVQSFLGVDLKTFLFAGIAMISVFLVLIFVLRPKRRSK